MEKLHFHIVIVVSSAPFQNCSHPSSTVPRHILWPNLTQQSLSPALLYSLPAGSESSSSPSSSISPSFPLPWSCHYLWNDLHSRPLVTSGHQGRHRLAWVCPQPSVLWPQLLGRAPALVKRIDSFVNEWYITRWLNEWADACLNLCSKRYIWNPKPIKVVPNKKVIRDTLK